MKQFQKFSRIWVHSLNYRFSLISTNQSRATPFPAERQTSLLFGGMEEKRTEEGREIWMSDDFDDGPSLRGVFAKNNIPPTV